MKYTRLISFIALAFFAFSCSDDNESNKNAKIEFKSTELEMRYGGDFLSVPIQVSGSEALKSPVKVKIEATDGSGAFGAKVDKDFVITSYDVIIPAGATEGYIEVKFYTAADEINFGLKIVTVSGAELGTVTSSSIKIAKTDYDRLLGSYILDCDGDKFNVTVKPKEADKSFYVDGIQPGYPFVMTYDAETESLNVEGLQKIADVNFTGLGICAVKLVTLVNNEGYSETDPVDIPATWNDNFTQITFQENLGLFYGVYASTGFAGRWTDYLYASMVMTKVK